VLVDGVVGAFHLTGQIGRISMWWIELAVLPFAVVGIPILKRCLERWPRSGRRAFPRHRWRRLQQATCHRDSTTNDQRVF